MDKRALERENSAAADLARLGYRVQQNPSRAEVAAARRRTGDSGDPGTDPDYVIEGRVFDCYAPTTASVRNVWSNVRGKVEEGQTQRVVLDIRDWIHDVAALRRQFTTFAVPGLKELKVITRGGAVIDIDVRSD